MSYGKRDEDAEAAVVKIDRISVYQEGVKLSLFPNIGKLVLTPFAHQPAYSRHRQV